MTVIRDLVGCITVAFVIMLAMQFARDIGLIAFAPALFTPFGFFLFLILVFFELLFLRL